MGYTSMITKHSIANLEGEGLCLYVSPYRRSDCSARLGRSHTTPGTIAEGSCSGCESPDQTAGCCRLVVGGVSAHVCMYVCMYVRIL